MEKPFYKGQPLIIKETGDRVTFAYDDDGEEIPCIVLHGDSYPYHIYCEYDELEPSTQFTFSEIMAGLEQRYFEVGTTFRRFFTSSELTVKESYSGLYLQGSRELPTLTSQYINSTWDLVETRKEMNLEEVEAELGYKINLK